MNIVSISKSQIVIFIKKFDKGSNIHSKFYIFYSKPFYKKHLNFTKTRSDTHRSVKRRFRGCALCIVFMFRVSGRPMGVIRRFTILWHAFVVVTHFFCFLRVEVCTLCRFVIHFRVNPSVSIRSYYAFLLPSAKGARSGLNHTHYFHLKK